MSAKNLQRVVADLTEMKAYAEKELARFSEAILVDPAYTLSWGRTAYEAGANLRVAKEVLAGIAGWREREPNTADDLIISGVAQTLFGQVINRAGSPESSTSPTSNLMERYELAALVKALDLIGFGRHATKIVREG
jgi:hypothetical protein